MKKHKRFLFCLFTFLIVLSFHTLILGTGLLPSSSKDQFADVRIKILDMIAKENIPSISVAVARDGKIIWEEGFG